MVKDGAPGDLAALTGFSAAIGTDPLIVQAAGGNTSVKSAGNLWVKASGTWLADAASANIMVAVDHVTYRDAVLNGDAGAEHPQSYARDTRSGLRPSVETAMHAVLPHRFVAHVHCVDTIAWSVQKQAEAMLAERLSGFAWAFVRYIKPGVALARAIARDAGGSDVLVLGNHGLVVGAASVCELESRLAAVRNRLQRSVDPRRRLPAAAERALLGAALKGTRFRPVSDPAAHALAFVPDLAGIAAAGTLYPDHAVFLGPGLQIVDAGHPLPGETARGGAPKALLVRDCGVAIHEETLRGAGAMVRCLTDVVTRLRTDDELVYLDGRDIADLLDWDAEKYRQAMNLDQRAIGAS